MSQRVVKKFGGATLSTASQILAVAHDLKLAHDQGHDLIVIVSAMGQTTNQLIHLAQQVSHRPPRREMDMLLSVGERISMSLLSMSLQSLGCPAISYTGSQAGILTDEAHSNAFILDVVSPRVEESLQQKRIVIIAGFQGVSPKTREITTLGRGGTDTTAVAMTAALQAHHCEILKDVPGVFTADPKICPTAFPIESLSYEQMLEMTFWGAKVLHYRSVELALQKKISLFIGPAHRSGTTQQKGLGQGPLEGPSQDLHKGSIKSSIKGSIEGPLRVPTTGTWVGEKELSMYENRRIISVNSHSEVLELPIPGGNLSEGLQELQRKLTEREIPLPQLLGAETLDGENDHLYVTGPEEVLKAIKEAFQKTPQGFLPRALCTVTATLSGASTPEMALLISQHLRAEKIEPLRIWMSAMSCTLLIDAESRTAAIRCLHELI